jgi:hypothetical protein
LCVTSLGLESLDASAKAPRPVTNADGSARDGEAMMDVTQDASLGVCLGPVVLQWVVDTRKLWPEAKVPRDLETEVSALSPTDWVELSRMVRSGILEHSGTSDMGNKRIAPSGIPDAQAS